MFKIKGGLYKARLVARGIEQLCEDIGVYAPVAGLSTFRLFIAIATQKKLSIHQIYVTLVFYMETSKR